MPDHNLLLYGLIVGCEAAFWLVLGLALAARYLLKRERSSRALLLSLPVIDLLLLVFTAVDLKSGTPATHAHGLATAYVGFTVAFGGIAVRWADQRFAHFFAGGPAPLKPPALGWAAVRKKIAEENLNIDSIGGMTLGADPISLSVGMASATENPDEALQVFTVRKEPKGHGRGKQIEGNFAEGQTVVVVDDVITTGGSTIKAIDVIEREGGKVAFALVLVDREEGGRERIEAEGYTVRSLATASEIVARMS